MALETGEQNPDEHAPHTMLALQFQTIRQLALLHEDGHFVQPPAEPPPPLLDLGDRPVTVLALPALAPASWAVQLVIKVENRLNRTC